MPVLRVNNGILVNRKDTDTKVFTSETFVSRFRGVSGQIAFPLLDLFL